MKTEELPPELLLPPKRLGTLLAEARLSGGYSLVEAADALGMNWSPVELLEVETGRRPVLDPDLEQLTDLYGIATTSLIPERSRLVIDLDEKVLGVGDRKVVLGGDVVQEREVLGQYLAMVYTMRDLRPGLSVPLRTPDLEVLSFALERPTEELETELRQMMVDAGAVVEPKMQRLRGRVLIPAIGLIVAATAAGVLLLVNDSDATPAPEGTNPPAAVTTDIGDAVVQERLPDGTPGPVQVRD
jgi:transcriptional regulator with XRE-family HTH domain